MSSQKDPLAKIFAQHLFNSMVEDESTDDFLARVIAEYLRGLSATGATMTADHRLLIESDLKEEVLEMLRKKTYGHFSLAEYRKTKTKPAAVKVAPPAAVPRKKSQNPRSRRSS
jgi:hypothetical protein